MIVIVIATAVLHDYHIRYRYLCRYHYRYRYRFSSQPATSASTCAFSGSLKIS